MFKNILVAFDGSDQSKRALREAADLARLNQARLTVVSVVDVPDYAGTIDEVDDLVKRGNEFFQANLTKAVEEYKCEGINITGKLLYGHVGSTITQFAEEIKADLIAAGSHGRSAITNLVLGSVSNFVIKHAHCPVLVVRQ